MGELDHFTHAEWLVELGHRLYGRDWQSAIAREHDVNLRTIQRIARAAKNRQAYPVPRDLLLELADYLVEQGQADVDAGKDIIAALGGDHANDDLNHLD